MYHVLAFIRSSEKTYFFLEIFEQGSKKYCTQKLYLFHTILFKSAFDPMHGFSQHSISSTRDKL
jgi:hypothetical protein